MRLMIEPEMIKRPAACPVKARLRLAREADDRARAIRVRAALETAASAGRPKAPAPAIPLESVPAPKPTKVATIEKYAAVEVPDDAQIYRIGSIVKAASKLGGATVTDIISERRSAKLVRIRFVIALISRQRTVKSFPEIGRQLGNRDHTTIIHAIDRAIELSASDPEFADLMRATTALAIEMEGVYDVSGGAPATRARPLE